MTCHADCAQVKDIGSVAQVCTTWRHVVAESPELYDKPLRASFSAAAIADAESELTWPRGGITVPADARTLIILCRMKRSYKQSNLYVAFLL